MRVKVNFFHNDDTEGDPFLAYETTTFYPPYKTGDVIVLRNKNEVDHEATENDFPATSFEVTSIAHAYMQSTIISRGVFRVDPMNMCILNVYLKRVIT